MVYGNLSKIYFAVCILYGEHYDLYYYTEVAK